MKKLVIPLAIIVLLLCIIKKENNRIPEESIRFRVLANTNLENDQAIKKKITENILQELKPLKYFKNINETREYIENNLPKIDKIIGNTLRDNNIDAVYDINYGNNIFPRKVFQDEIYEEGEYESLVITLGKGEGDNFWCVLFPPICFLEDDENIEYTSWLKEVIDKYF